MTHLLPLLAAFALQPSTTASPPVKNGDIVVTGRKAADRATVQQYVNMITQRSGQQVARFHDEVCPVVIGMADAPALAIENRIRETTVGIGAKVAASRRCNANLVLIIAEDGGQLVRNLRAKRPDWLAGLSTGQVKRLIAEPSGARAWTVASLRNEDGLAMGETGSNNTSALENVPMMRVSSASIINLPTRADIDGSVIILDRKVALGMSLAQLADYAAMRGLARTRPPSESRIGTILGLFAGGEGIAPLEMTGADIAYLQSLYRSSGRAQAVGERSRIAREMTRTR